MEPIVILVVNGQSKCQNGNLDIEFFKGKNIHFADPEKAIFTYYGLLRAVYNEKPDLIIVAGFSIATIKLWFFSFFKRIPYIIWSGDIKRKSQRVSFIRTIQRKILVKRASGFISYGTKAKEYLVSLGAGEEDISIGINTVDTEYSNIIN